MSKNERIPGCGFHHVAIRARDFDKSCQFYTEIMGFREKIAWGEAPERAVMLDVGDGNYLEIFERPDQPGPVEEPQPAILHMAFRARDTSTALENARSAGVRVTVETKEVLIPSHPHPTPVTLAFFEGPDGEIIELFQNELT